MDSVLKAEQAATSDSPAGVNALPSKIVDPRSAFAANSLFVGVAPAVFEKIRVRIKIVTFAPDEVVFREGEKGDCLYLIGSGSIRISKRNPGGHQETLNVLLARDYFGEMALIDREPRSAQASAVEKTNLGLIDRETWDLLLRFAPNEIMANFTRSVMQRLRQNNQHFIEQMSAISNSLGGAAGG